MLLRYPIPIFLSGTNMDWLSGGCDGTYRFSEKLYKGNLKPAATYTEGNNIKKKPFSVLKYSGIWHIYFLTRRSRQFRSRLHSSHLRYFFVFLS